jgi:hypothetical protein
VVEACGVSPLRSQVRDLLGANYPLGPHSWCKKAAIYPDSCRKTFKSVVHGYDVYSTEVDPKDPTLSRFLS